MFHYYLDNDIIYTAGRLPVNCEDRGLLYGFSLFETMLVHRGRLIMPRRHMERLYRSAGVLGINIPAGIEGMTGTCGEVVNKSGVKNGALRVTVTAGTEKGEQGMVLFTVRDGTAYNNEHYEKGFALRLLSFTRSECSPLVAHKTANYLENLLGRREALIKGYHEGLFLNSRGKVAEGTASNIFIVKGNEIITPPPEAGLLPGTVRRLVIEESGRLGYCCREDNFTVGDIEKAGECFLTNSLMGIMPVTSINGLPIGNGKPGPVTRDMMRVYPPEE